MLTKEQEKAEREKNLASFKETVRYRVGLERNIASGKDILVDDLRILHHVVRTTLDPPSCSCCVFQTCGYCRHYCFRVRVEGVVPEDQRLVASGSKGPNPTSGQLS
eukprot:Hpha_TRINITY_DN21658_c0_g1::TRINITY_DN21658_c0_g1_i1::g.63888::m.63888